MVHWLKVNTSKFFCFKVETDAGRHKKYNFKDGPVNERSDQTINVTVTDLMLLRIEDSNSAIKWEEKAPCSDQNTRCLCLVARPEDCSLMLNYIKELQKEMTALEQSGVQVYCSNSRQETDAQAYWAGRWLYQLCGLALPVEQSRPDPSGI